MKARTTRKNDPEDGLSSSERQTIKRVREELSTSKKAKEAQSLVKAIGKKVVVQKKAAATEQSETPSLIPVMKRTGSTAAGIRTPYNMAAGSSVDDQEVPVDDGRQKIPMAQLKTLPLVYSAISRRLMEYKDLPKGDPRRKVVLPIITDSMRALFERIEGPCSFGEFIFWLVNEAELFTIVELVCMGRGGLDDLLVKALVNKTGDAASSSPGNSQWKDFVDFFANIRGPEVLPPNSYLEAAFPRCSTVITGVRLDFSRLHLSRLNPDVDVPAKLNGALMRGTNFQSYVFHAQKDVVKLILRNKWPFFDGHGVVPAIKDFYKTTLYSEDLARMAGWEQEYKELCKKRYK